MSTIAFPSTKTFDCVGIVVFDNVPVYKSASTSSRKIQTCSIGDVFFVQESEPLNNEKIYKKKWRKILLDNNKIGYIQSKNIGIVYSWAVFGKPRNEITRIFKKLPRGKLISEKEGTFCFWIRHVKLVNKKRYYGIQILENLGSVRDLKDPSIPIVWVYPEDVDLNFVALYHYAGAYLIGDFGSVDWNPDKNLNNAEIIYKMMLEKYPDEIYWLAGDTFYPSSSSSFPSCYIYHSGWQALSSLSRVSIKKGEYQEAINYLKEVEVIYPDRKSKSGLTAGFARLLQAGIHEKYLNKPDKAIEIYTSVIVDFPNQVISGYEWRVTIEYFALREIDRILDEGKDYSDEYKESTYNNILKATENPYLKLKVGLKKSKLYINRKDYNRAVEILDFHLNNIKIDETNQELNLFAFKNELLSEIIDIYIRYLHDIDGAHNYCDRIIKECKETNLKEYARILHFYILDISGVSKQEVLKKYEELKSFEIDAGLCTNERSFYGPRKFYEVMSNIRYFPELEGKLNGEVNITLAPLENALVLKKGNEGELIKILYFRSIDEKRFYKIELENGMIGWIPGDSFEFLPGKAIFSNKRDKKTIKIPNWAMFTHNTLNDGFVNCRGIKSPELKGYYTIVQNMFFYDVNNDNISDIILIRRKFNKKNELLILDGKDRSTIHREAFKRENQYIKYGIICDNILYFTDANSDLTEYDLKRKQILKIIKLKDIGSLGKFAIYKDKYISTARGDLLIVDKNTGDLIKKEFAEVRSNAFCLSGDDLYYIETQKDDSVYLVKYSLIDYKIKKKRKIDIKSGNLSFYPLLLSKDNLLIVGWRKTVCLNRESLRVNWECNDGTSHYCRSSVDKSSIFLTNNYSKKLKSIDLKTGNLNWKVSLDQESKLLGTIITKDLVYTASRAGIIYALDKETGKLIWEFNTNTILERIEASNGKVLALKTFCNDIMIISEKE